MTMDRFGVYDPANWNNRWGTPLMDIAGPIGRFEAADTRSTQDTIFANQYGQAYSTNFNQPGYISGQDFEGQNPWGQPGASRGRSGGPSGGGMPLGNGAQTATQGSWWQNPRLWGSVIGGIGSYLDAREMNESAGPQAYNSQSERNPWGPSVDYRTTAMERALALLNGGGGGGGGRGGRGGGGGGGGGGFGNSRSLADAMSRYAQGDDPLVSQGRGYIGGALNDPYGGSALLGRTFETAAGLGDDDLNSFITALMGEWTGDGRPRNLGGGRGVSMGNFDMGGGGGGGGPAVTPHGLVGVRDDLRELLDTDYAANGNPELDAMIAAAVPGITEAYQTGLAGLSGAAELAGATTGTGGGSSDYQLADAQAAQRFGQTLAQNETGLRYADYERHRAEIMEALGLGTQYDLGMSDIDSRERVGMAEVGARNAATGAASRSASEANALQRELGNRGLILQALGLRGDLQGMGLEAMVGLSDMDVANRQFMLGAIPSYHDIQMSDLERAFGANFGLENTQAQRQDRARAEAAANARYQANLPWQRLAQYMDIINAASQGGGSATESGVTPGGPRTSEWGAALQGILGGGAVAQNLYNGYQGRA